MRAGGRQSRRAGAVSVLFSEPKILNPMKRSIAIDLPEFQCSSASRKFSIACLRASVEYPFRRFSALQRAENSQCWMYGNRSQRFSSFSALQRAENSQLRLTRSLPYPITSFSALQRAENSQCWLEQVMMNAAQVSVLFSEPKILNPDPRTCVHPYFRPR